MPQAGDRVVVQGNKIGSPTRVGTLVKTVGTMIRVRWENGTESLFQPAAGSVTYETGGNGGRGKGAGRTVKAKPAAKAAPKAATTKASKASVKPAKASKPAAKAATKRAPAGAKSGKKTKR